MKFFKGYLFYTILFIFSFVVFLYLSFPYAILKEAVISQVSKATGYTIRVDSLGPNLPVGFHAEGVLVGLQDVSRGIKVKELDVNVSLLSIIIGKISASLELISDNDGFIDLGVNFGILDLISQSFIPSSINLDAENFQMDSLFRFGLGYIDENFPGFGFVSSFKGDLDGEIELNLDTSDLSQSSGIMKIGLKKATLALDPSLNLGLQNFKKAQVEANMKSGSLKFLKKSGLQSQLLKVGFAGDVKLKKRINSSALNLKVGIELYKDLKDQIGPLLSSFSGSSDGKINVAIRGILANPKVTTN